MPELPKPVQFNTPFVYHAGPGVLHAGMGFTTNQMRSYGLACFREGMLRAAGIAEGKIEAIANDEWVQGSNTAAELIAAAIKKEAG